MNRIIDGRGTGKTKELMEVAKANHGIILCANPYAMESKAKAYGITGISFFSYDTILNPDSRVPVYIDEIENYMKCRLPNLSGYTLSNED